MTGFDPLDLSSTPAGAPLVPLLPIRMRRTEILTVVYRTGRDAAEALVPRPLELASDLCVLHVYHMHDAEWFGDYCESAWQLPVTLPDGTPAVYSPFLVLESDAAVAAGREAYGQPKKAGQVCLEGRGDLLVGGADHPVHDLLQFIVSGGREPVPDLAHGELLEHHTQARDLFEHPWRQAGYPRAAPGRAHHEALLNQPGKRLA